MKMLKDIKNVTTTRKFWTALVGGLVTFASIQFNSPEWLSGVTLAATALGVYQVPNQK
jgi:hypothetical protein